MKAAVLAGLLASIQAASAVAVYGQCGGLQYTGSTVCDAGSTCVYLGEYYSQCQPGAAVTTSKAVSTTSKAAGTTSTTSKAVTTTSATTTTKSPTTTSVRPSASSSVCPGAVTKFKYFGTNQSGGEFGEKVWPGTLGKEYTWPSPSSIDYFVGKGFNTFRVGFLIERVSPPANGLTGAFDSAYLAGLKSIISYITSKGAYAVLDPHNYMRYNNAVITSTSDFQTWWKNLANEFKSDKNVIFDVVNEPYGIDAGAVFQLNQAAVNGIRSSGATSQLILVEGTAWSGAWSWTTSSGNSNYFAGIKDPNNNTAIEMHQYLDSDSSGTNPACVSSTIGAERLAAATAWLKANNLKGFLGEIGAGSNDVCIAAVKGALCSMQESGVWIGALWWAAGPWWPTDYFQSIEPPNGAAISRILPEALLPFL